MNLPKAIKILSNSANAGVTTFDQDFRDAEKLGIEAIKRLLWLREVRSQIGASKLKGETEE